MIRAATGPAIRVHVTRIAPAAWHRSTPLSQEKSLTAETQRASAMNQNSPPPADDTPAPVICFLVGFFLAARRAALRAAMTFCSETYMPPVSPYGLALVGNSRESRYCDHAPYTPGANCCNDKTTSRDNTRRRPAITTATSASSSRVSPSGAVSPVTDSPVTPRLRAEESAPTATAGTGAEAMDAEAETAGTVGMVGMEASTRPASMKGRNAARRRSYSLSTRSISIRI